MTLHAADPRETVPLAKTMAEKITAQRNWSVGRARNASIPRSTGDGHVPRVDLA